MRRIIVLLLAASAMLAAGVAYNLSLAHMNKIRFHLGKNIHETAKHSGAPRFATRNVAGLISYKLLDLPSDVIAIYELPGYEVSASPLFAFTLYADTENNNNLAVETASLQFAMDELRSHESAKAYIENLLAQFEKGKWRRFIHDLCPAVTGRSSFLNEIGDLNEKLSCPIDPHYHLSMDDWIKLIRMTQSYEWLGEDTLATLTVSFREDADGPAYSARLEFQDFEIKNRRDLERTSQDLAEGDANGRNSTVRAAKELAEARLRIKKLEEMAVERGDALVPR